VRPGYILGSEHWGRGYANEAQRRLTEFDFGELALHRVEADTHPDNTASLRSLERLGFQREGVLRERWIVAGEVSDSVVLGLLARDWRG
jgi:ribosomal-protein-alanine N-acetyltransferase